MSSPTFKTTEVAQLYEEIGCWSHPEHPFLDPKYSLESNVPAIDLTPYVTTWLAAGREDAIAELLGFLAYRDDAFSSELAFQDAQYALRKILKARLPSGVQLSETAQHELHAICILTLRAACRDNKDMSCVGTELAATTLACRQMTFDPAFADELIRLVSSELRDDETDDSDSIKESGEKARFAVETALSPLGVAESASERLKVVPPMARFVVYDYIRSGRDEGLLRFGLNYEDRMYGCGAEANQQYVDWLGFFGLPDDNGFIPYAVNKEILLEALKERGVECKPNAIRKTLLKQAHEIPGLLTNLISRHCPEQRQFLPEWKESVNDWARRVQCVELVAAALIKFMALSTLNEKGTAKPFFHNLPSYSIFKTLSQVANGAGQFISQNLDQDTLDVWPALELVRLFEVELPRGFKYGPNDTIVPDPGQDWPSRWKAALGDSGDKKAQQAFDGTGRMVALKSSGVWQSLGDGAGGYGDTLGNPFPPFAFDSGMRVDEVSREGAQELGLI
jgi:hypothetical protein